jgi:hypothetical protein
MAYITPKDIPVIIIPMMHAVPNCHAHNRHMMYIQLELGERLKRVDGGSCGGSCGGAVVSRFSDKDIVLI